MKITNPPRIQIQWWSAPLAVLLSLALFFVLSSLGVFCNLNDMICSFFMGAIPVFLFFGINFAVAQRKARKQKP